MILQNRKWQTSLLEGGKEDMIQCEELQTAEIFTLRSSKMDTGQHTKKRVRNLLVTAEDLKKIRNLKLI